MSNRLQPSLDLAAMVIAYGLEWRRMVKDEARLLMRQHGPSACDTARDVAALARHRRDRRSTLLWEAVAREIVRKQAGQS
jgi:hypothetical protein